MIDSREALDGARYMWGEICALVRKAEADAMTRVDWQKLDLLLDKWAKVNRDLRFAVVNQLTIEGVTPC